MGHLCLHLDDGSGVCVSTSWCMSLFIEGGFLSVRPLLSLPGTQACGCSGLKQLQQAPRLAALDFDAFSRRRFSPRPSPRPQCLSPPGPRCSKLVPAQSFIDFKIEANSGLKKRKGRRETRERATRQRPERDRVRDAGVGGRGTNRDGVRTRVRDTKRDRDTEAQRHRKRNGKRVEQARDRRHRQRQRQRQGLERQRLAGELWKQKDL